MPPLSLNDTAAYYARSEPQSLFWEMTVSECLARLETPYQTALERPERYGKILARLLVDRVGLAPSWSVVEVGGGYGNLMAALLEAVPLTDVTMVDVSPFFSGHQARSLCGRAGCRFVTANVMDYFDHRGQEVDLVISNENLGDLPTVTGIPRDALLDTLESGRGRGMLGTVAAVIQRYDLDLADAPDPLHFNLGAIQYLERLRPRAKAVFVSEHSADTSLPPGYDFLPLEPTDGYPRRIRLHGHDEYSIRFRHLEQVAQALGYRVERLHMVELIGLRRDAGIRFMARVGATNSEVAEAVHEFCAHVAEYQCLLLTR